MFLSLHETLAAAKDQRKSIKKKHMRKQIYQRDAVAMINKLRTSA